MQLVEKQETVVWVPSTTPERQNTSQLDTVAKLQEAEGDGALEVDMALDVEDSASSASLASSSAKPPKVPSKPAKAPDPIVPPMTPMTVDSSVPSRDAVELIAPQKMTHRPANAVPSSVPK